MLINDTKKLQFKYSGIQCDVRTFNSNIVEHLEEKLSFFLFKITAYKVT